MEFVCNCQQVEQCLLLSEQRVKVEETFYKCFIQGLLECWKKNLLLEVAKDAEEKSEISSGKKRKILF